MMDNLLKKGILYDYLQVKGGAEHVALTLSEHYEDAHLLVSSINPDNFDLSLLATQNIQTLQSFSSITPLRILKTIYSFKQSQSYINQFDQVIYSGIYAPLAISQRAKGNNFYYCHTPPRYLYDLKDDYQQKLGVLGRVFLQRYSSWYQPQYEQSIQRMDRVIANSINVQKRLKRFLNVDSIVINPPVNIDRFGCLGQEGEYYLSLARLEPYKQVDKIIEAFKRMPDKKLVIASGGSDSDRLKQLALSAHNISFTGWYSEAELVQLLGNAIASIYIAKDEDFGLSPVESQAAGKPVIGIAQGGLLETVKHGETGYLIDPELINLNAGKDKPIEENPLIDATIKATEWMTPQRALSLKNECLENSKNYHSRLFFEQMDAVLSKA
ncbi:MAG: glycosyltransferase [gamma proteobacterium symbiont of Bathyaustriella thionipta]|nr:glycosyltransferase [gamma proteobacterium symbiont of Bathyaustriella thionipta]MCU7949185.1 glycosyltransferase [gamma proteobacterium symbiont of Bathyaustriella thionipta]MCU7954781.1 glycosyltransferase [gamma proteobacterium symbiont of Bathyaustriella thionipta]MCU7956926.1 glycosyltransferase [gamma proteobacterium symbiont of Bathyaustriella thionipta]MCU7966794.1 glycosyltransferase [gamma proteobacterium symbiont of Bathyaustriella thionipta]